MNSKIVGLAAVSTLLMVPAHAEIGRGPGPGRAYISVEGGGQHSDGPAVAAHGDLSTTSAFNPDAAGAAAVFAGPGLVEARRVNESPAADQINTEVTTGPAASISALSTTDNSNAATEVSADSLGFLNAFVDAFSTSSADRATADAQGGSFIKAEDGAYGSLTFGYGFRQPYRGFDRIEIYGTYSRATDDSHVDGAAGAISVDGTSAFAAAVILPDGFTPTAQSFGAVTTDVEMKVSFAELGARLKADRWTYNSVLLTAGLEGFYAAYNQDTDMHASIGGAIGDFIGNSFSRSADVDSDMFGLMVSLEGQMPIGGTPLSLIGRTFGGFYYLNADGKFRDDFGLADVSDSETDWGYRIGVEAGVRYDLSSRAFLSVTGSIDHFSDVATADLPRFAGDVAHVGTDDLTNYKVGARLTLTLGNDEPASFK